VLLTRFSELRQKAFARTGKSFPVIVVQEAGLDGFWIHRVLQNFWVGSKSLQSWLESLKTKRNRLIC
jgi:transposase